MRFFYVMLNRVVGVVLVLSIPVVAGLSAYMQKGICGTDICFKQACQEAWESIKELHFS